MNMVKSIRNLTDIIIIIGLDYDSTVMLTYKLLFATAKSIIIVEVGLDMPKH